MIARERRQAAVVPYIEARLLWEGNSHTYSSSCFKPSIAPTIKAAERFSNIKTWSWRIPASIFAFLGFGISAEMSGGILAYCLFLVYLGFLRS